MEGGIKPKKSKKGLKIFIFIILALAILIAGAYFVLNVEQGEVLANSQRVQGNVKLKQGDIIETKQGGLATVILYESVVINIEENTKINIDNLIKEHPEVSQESGETWNTFTKLAGVEGYTVKTGNSIASVRATAFGLKQDYIIGGEGTVDYEINGEDFSVFEKEVVETSAGTSVKRAASQQEIQKIKLKIERAVRQLKKLREVEIKKKQIVYNIIKSKTGFSDEEILGYLEDIDRGDIDVDELSRQSPVELESIKKIAEITKSIQNINRKMKELYG